MDTNPGRVHLLVGLIAALALAACSGGAAPTTSPTANVQPSPTAADSTVAVHGVEDCQIIDAVYEGTTDRERFHCQETTSDARLNGEWETWYVTEETGGGLGTWTGELVMTNSGGTWRGKASGTTTGIPGNPVNLGLVVWVGEGGYSGLTYHEFVYGSNDRLDTAGWVEPS